ncbi:MAG TPA: hypothetical protein PLV46_18450 [Reyranella sp.]|jgi:hypothetical protein|uniref:hypothetical protein n=2 Tax=Reyranella sp. TaxID=1929291 RepID=UPI002CFDEB76|nr:hypothetical protein [Reyranella sp.]HQS16456.1 hypothetical protein [Reyranella sp.]HQT13444.1 hypothetical protein [Reyranella sp.]
MIVSFVGVLMPVGMAQSVELKPIDRIDASDLPYSRSPYYGLSPEQVKDFAALREEYRKSQWADEAGRIARYGQNHNVIRDDDYLYINDASGGRPFAFRNIWGVEPAALYAYLAYDDLAHFHIVGEGGHDMPRLLFISAKTGLVYQGFGAGEPIYSRDQKRLLSVGIEGMGHPMGVAIYRFDGNKPVAEGVYDIGHSAPCSIEWLGPTEVKALCPGAWPEDGKFDYRLTYLNDRWHSSRQLVAK